ncbi:uncharacterized protein LOC135842628 [Planococcus citri]|uniref:uncharacterized protein LOC135842628 n=1 Tax=Planococcus citri TaxID=170843 RepID=UPI0031F74528
MIANEHSKHYGAFLGKAAEDTVDFANDMELDHDYDILPTIAAENAALKVKLKQECDIAHVTKNNISKADIRIEALKRDIAHCDELIETKTQELAKLGEELTNLCISREHIRSNTENLKRQHELIAIEDDQRKKEQDSVRSNYEKMIRNRKEIFNSNRLVVRRNNLRNQCEGARIQSAVLEERLKELHRQKRQFREIQNLHLKSASVELAQVWLDNKNEKDRIVPLKNKLREKKETFDKILAAKSKAENDTRSPGSRFVSLPMPTFSQPLSIPSLNAEETELTKYFRRINVFKKSRSPCLLPNVLARTISLKEKEPSSSKNTQASNPSPVMKSSTLNSNEKLDIIEKKSSESPKLSLEEATKTRAFQPVNSANAVSEEIVEIKLQDSDPAAITEKPRQTPAFVLDKHSPNSPEKVNSKFKPVEKHVSPLTVSRMSPLNTPSNKSPMRISRIPVPLSTSSPINANSRIPVRFSPVNVKQKRDYVEKENISHRMNTVKKIDRSSPLDILIDTTDVSRKGQAFKRSDVGSPKKGIKCPKMDYAYLNANLNATKNLHDNDEMFTKEVDQDRRQIRKNYRSRDEFSVENAINEINNENNPMIKSYMERMRMMREEYGGKDSRNEKYEDDIEVIQEPAKDSKKSDVVARESYGHLNKNAYVPKSVSDSDEIPTIEVDQIEDDIDENDISIKSHYDRMNALRGYVNKDTRKDIRETDDIEMLKKSTKDSKRPETFAREAHKTDSRHFIKDQTDVCNKYNDEFSKHSEKFQTNYRADPKDFRAIEKVNLEANLKHSVSRFEKMDEITKKLPDKMDRFGNKYNDPGYSTNNENSGEFFEKLSKSSSSSSDYRNRSEAFSPFGSFTSPPDSNKYSPPFAALGERGGSMFSYDTGVNQLFGSSTDGTSSQSQNQNNGFFGFSFTSSMEQNDQPLKMF